MDMEYIKGLDLPEDILEEIRKREEEQEVWLKNYRKQQKRVFTVFVAFFSYMIAAFAIGVVLTIIDKDRFQTLNDVLYAIGTMFGVALNVYLIIRNIKLGKEYRKFILLHSVLTLFFIYMTVSQLIHFSFLDELFTLIRG